MVSRCKEPKNECGNPVIWMEMLTLSISKANPFNTAPLLP
jgi:hypothetical protein